jgi:hypothetical protein
MSKRKFLIFVSLILAVAVFAWTSGDALAQAKGAKDVAKEKVAKDVAAKGKVTRDDQAKYLGKVTPSEQKAAAKRARQLGLLPGIAGRTAQTPSPDGTR